MPARRFTDAQREQMAERREAGESCPKIGRRFGCSASNVRWICLALGADHPKARLTPATARGPAVIQRGDHVVRRFLPDEDTRLLALAGEGLSNSAIGKVLGRPAVSIRGRLMTLARREARAEAA
ncbi:helix-turn-helix domain-containing protein [Methylobacterium mesophilicum SR1.6/6]|uniref:Helix-turn-helix domain-containing protein n=1 Tax=Methylobacterium mesophilicum SR1.6/6 TaxID=908290 RepID=A0A6B9FUK0_9HYPH|nr:hypothetical protein [Methylobacterium mesophilicum]QGY05549.1 helix-turn-helix domain-containing protein [Methylobacterium mesophilicum SR1.6/6]